MKISIIGQNPIYVSHKRGEAIKQSLLNGTEFIDIDGSLFKTSTITAITNETAPHRYGMDVETTPRLMSPKHERADENSPGYKRFQQMRKAILG